MSEAEDLFAMNEVIDRELSSALRQAREINFKSQLLFDQARIIGKKLDRLEVELFPESVEFSLAS